jgi:hypothetical protein
MVMRKVGNFDIFEKYDIFEIDMFGVNITKNCIKPNEDIVREMLKYSLINNSELFNVFHVEIYGSFNSNKRDTAYDVDMRIHIDYPFVKEQLDLLEPLLQKQIDISYNKFQLLLDISAYDFDKTFHTKNEDYIKYIIETNACYTVLYPSINNIRFNDNGYRFNINHFYKKYAISENWIPNEKHKIQLMNNQYTKCTKIQSIDDVNTLCNRFTEIPI